MKEGALAEFRVSEVASCGEPPIWAWSSQEESETGSGQFDSGTGCRVDLAKQIGPVPREASGLRVNERSGIVHER